MFCKNCGKENENGSLSCKFCGQDFTKTVSENISGEPTVNKTTTNKLKTNKILIVSIIVVFVLLFSCVLFFMFRTSTPDIEQIKKDFVEETLENKEYSITEFKIISETDGKNDEYEAIAEVVYDDTDIEYHRQYEFIYNKNKEWVLVDICAYDKESWQTLPIAVPSASDYTEECEEYLKIVNEYDNFSPVESKTTADLDSGKATFVFSVEKDTAIQDISGEIEFFFSFNEESGEWEMDDYAYADSYSVQYDLINTWSGDGYRKGYSYSTLLKIYRVLKEFFSARISDGSIIVNPMSTVKFYTKDFVLAHQQGVREEREKVIEKKDSGADLTKEEEALAFSKLRMQDKTEIRFLSDEEIERLKDVAYNGYVLEWTTKNGKQAKSGPHFLKQAKYFIFILNTGLRKGEAVALKYSDIDFNKKTMKIHDNITTVKKRDKDGRATGGIRSVRGTTKTKTSGTTIPINDTAIKILKEMLKEEPAGYDGYIANEGGHSLCESALRKRFDNLLRQAHVQHCGMHSLRHTFASKLFEITNGNSKLVSELIRHSSVSFTEDIYIHLKEKYKEHTIANFSI